MPAKRIRSSIPSVSGGGAPGVDITLPTFTAPEVDRFADRLTPRLALMDGEAFGDGQVIQPTLAETERYGDQVRPSAQFAAPEPLAHDDRVLFSYSETVAGRSATPDSDKWTDAWVDSAVGQTGVNHGNEAFLYITSLVGNVRNALATYRTLQSWNGLVNADIVNTDDSRWMLELYVRFRNTGLVAADVQCVMFNNATFTESTVTQSNRPTGTNIFSDGMQSIPAGQVSYPVSFRWWFTERQQIEDLIGRQQVFVFSGGSGLNTTDVALLGRENAIGSRPIINFGGYRY